MQFFAVLAMAAVAFAAPDLMPRTDRGSCNAEGKSLTCCQNSGLLAVLTDCTVQALNDECNTTAFCCETDNATGPGNLINVNALNCAKVL
ncbi:hypothetical protein HIM_01009 [Hirsutella minnesotensis 3608]|nr:hypothetical protein HIM_01009 [Hirsutella minnesotensis 3608]